MSDAKDTITIKVKRTTHQEVSELINKITAEGWSSVGADRTDPPTYASVVEEAIARLQTRPTKKR